MRVLFIGSDRSARGTSVAGTAAQRRQDAYARALGHVDDISFTLKSDCIGASAGEPRSVYPTNSSNRFRYVFDALRLARKLPRPDVVSAQDPFEAGLAALLIARRFRAPLHVQVHTDFLSSAYARHSLLNRMRVMLARFVLPRADGIRVVSERIGDSLQGGRWQLRTKPSVLPVFADLEHMRADRPDASLAARFAAFKTKVLVVSRLEPEKNVALAVRAFAKSAPQDACLIVVGQGSEKAALAREARERGVEARVFFEGDKDAAPYYALADLVLVASAYEGYGLVIVEALAAGKPVLSTDVGAAREAGAIVAPKERFADALAQWFQSGARAGELRGYPYRHFDEYVRAYAADIAACAGSLKTQ